MFHRHKMEVTQEEFFPPKMEVKEIKGYVDSELAMVIHGHTTVTQRCTECGAIKSERFIGKVKATS